MSDARNSSNNIRGGGAKQTGGAGRSNKHAQGSSRSNLLDGLNGQEHVERSEAKRKLQLIFSSKQLASDVRALLLEEHTEEEYSERNVPLPSTEDAKKKLKSMKEFTNKWYDKAFREEWLCTVTGVWIAEIKAQYDAAVAAAAQPANKPDGEPQSIEELTELISNLDASVPSEERQRLKKKLKKKKQKKAKKDAASEKSDDKI